MNYQNESSGLYLYSLGYVSEDIVEDSLFVKVVPIEIISDIEGDLTNTTKETNNNVNIENENKVTIKSKDVVIVAKWLNLSDANRVTPPNVCKGETIRIFKYADTDKYFWSTLYNEIDLRKREKTVYAFSNKGSVEDESLLNNMYYFTFDTINKHVRIHTDDTDGELCTYDIEINTLDGMLTIIDGKKNFIELDSDNDKLTATIHKDIILNSENITMNSKKHTINTNEYILNATNSMTVKTNIHKFNATSSTLTTNITHTGNLDSSGGNITHEGSHIDSTHKHTGNLGFDVSTPNN